MKRMITRTNLYVNWLVALYELGLFPPSQFSVHWFHTDLNLWRWIDYSWNALRFKNNYLFVSCLVSKSDRQIVLKEDCGVVFILLSDCDDMRWFSLAKNCVELTWIFVIIILCSLMKSSGRSTGGLSNWDICSLIWRRRYRDAVVS